MVGTKTKKDEKIAKNNRLQSNFKNKTKKPTVIYFFIKRVFDILCGLIGTIILIPLTISIWITKIICKENDGPLFYEQLRIGKNGKIFRMYKYRSMCMNADKVLKNYLDNNKEAKEEFEKNRKIKNDPRITKVGKILRTTSLDEFPQFINILIGNMSLIGPRPVVNGEIEKYGKNKNKFLSAKPGVTGYWQANGRSNTTYEQRIEMELYYVDYRSIWTDVKIILKTVTSMIKKEGAY